MTMRFTDHVVSPVGVICLVSNDHHSLSELRFDLPYHTPKRDTIAKAGLCPVFLTAKKWLDCYFGGENPDFTLPLNPCGTPFQLQIWTLLRGVPYGESTTYGDIAHRFEEEYGRPMSAQAVGHAIGQNPIAIFIPCHRVIAAGGKIGGFRYGISIKRRLLELESASLFH